MIDKEKVLSLTQGGLNVFSHYLGFEVNLHRNFHSPFMTTERRHAIFTMTRRPPLISFMTMGILLIRGIVFGLLPNCEI